ncbi:MAG TPA: penicillin acylase family protein [Bryobacteraceae bacterium]|nr:penicillin acylase family protein [Bryobacteraceae bacterium]
MRALAVLIGAILIAPAARPADIALSGLHKPVEILRDRWGVPHIYAETVEDLFFAQGFIAARDRLFQIDLWRRIGTGKLSEALGPTALDRDRLARSVRWRGSLDQEWSGYGPDARLIAASFTSGINAYIRSLQGKRPPEFVRGGYDPGLWTPEDCVARVAGLLMTRNLTREVDRAQDVRNLGLNTVTRYLPPDPVVPVEIPNGLDLTGIDSTILRVYNQTIGPARFADQGSNNWVIDGALSITGKPLLANDPHRPVQLPSLRKTVHLVGPGWNAIGAGEPALPGIALGHNENVAWGFTIVGIDQQDLYVEKLDPANRDRYRYRGAWKDFEIERQQVHVKGEKQPVEVQLRYSVHGPIIHVDAARSRAYALRWVGSEPGSAGYLAGLALAQSKNWEQFRKAAARFKVPSENLVYADIEGNIGWQVVGLAPVRKNWSGLLPVPGDSGEYEWSGFRSPEDLPHSFNPASHFIATANHNILPPGYKIPLGYEWTQPFRFQRVQEMLSEPARKFGPADFERMQQDVLSIPARRFQGVLKRWGSGAPAVKKLLAWDARLTADSAAGAIYEVWIRRLPSAVFGPKLGARVELTQLLAALEADPHPNALAETLAATLQQLTGSQGPDMDRWQWGKLHQADFPHPLQVAGWRRGPVARPGDGFTVNATSGTGYLQTSGASFREILDVADWDRSVITNAPGESGDPASPHYSDLLNDWASGKYHPLPYTRKAVEAATVERIRLVPRP